MEWQQNKDLQVFRVLVFQNAATNFKFLLLRKIIP
jgi:hypothetical protein